MEKAASKNDGPWQVFRKSAVSQSGIVGPVLKFKLVVTLSICDDVSSLNRGKWLNNDWHSGMQKKT